MSICCVVCVFNFFCIHISVSLCASSTISIIIIHILYSMNCSSYDHIINTLHHAFQILSEIAKEKQEHLNCQGCVQNTVGLLPLNSVHVCNTVYVRCA